MDFGSTLPLAGVDEAGRGPLAGPVVAAAVALDPARPIEGLGDSKALSEKKRRALFFDIMKNAHVGIGIAEPAEIDRLNILHATMAAMRRAVLGLSVVVGEIQIDGNRVPENLPWPASAIVKGDAKVAAIGAASIIAKTVRDDLMVLADARFPGYGLAKHKGYPSPVHREALERLGPCPIHRMSYAPVRKALESRQPRDANHCG
ncbi:ribonuclease HII [Maricaulis sp.]|uniref:ribonuclease HII n=1 Tax=unclassified Maricaulis TaxID=2632371 RepID=UPI001B16EC80|nr:ribonuclease HII [Maricaulis sp.]MBO6797540.1 ribonuclease HII [Maricaulis sp.]